MGRRIALAAVPRIRHRHLYLRHQTHRAAVRLSQSPSGRATALFERNAGRSHRACRGRLRHRCYRHGRATRQRARGERRPAWRAVDGVGVFGHGLGEDGRRIRAEEDGRCEFGSFPARARLDRGGAQHHAGGGSASDEDAGASGRGLPHSSRDHPRVVQELRHLRENVPGALPAAERGPHRGAGRAGQVHGLPAVRMAVSRFRDPGASRHCGGGARVMNVIDTSLTGKNAVKLISGNHACALGAIAAGCRFFAGYPITPSSEIAERLARHLPEVDGVFVQMEDEIASIAAVIGASMGGVKAMTATSGPGFSLKQENIGYAAGAEIPCVIVNVMRGGPSTGMPTRPSQADLMQARWGSHGDYPIIALTPASVGEIYSETIRAFDLAEQCRSPVVLLYDQVIAQLSETVVLNNAANSSRTERKWASGPRAVYKPYDSGSDAIPAMAKPGDGYRTHTTGLTHSESGFPTQNPEAVTRNLSRLFSKLDRHRDLIDSSETLHCDDADVVVVAIGISARAAKRAVELCRAQGLRVGLFRPITFWPFPEKQLCQAAAKACAVLVPEMNTGQLRLVVERVLGGTPVEGIHLFSGEAITPADIAARAAALARGT